MREKILIKNGTIVNPDCEPLMADVFIIKDKIELVGFDLDFDAEIIDAKNMVVTPGLIDQHIHGGYGCDFNKSSVDEILELAEKLPVHGITSIVPTIMTAPVAVIQKQIQLVKLAKEKLAHNNTKFLGIHLEGPYLCPKYKGIQPESSILTPTVENFKKIEDKEIKIVSFSPELDVDFELTKYLAAKNIVPSAGHTSASSVVIKEANKFGLKQITHLFNAMPQLHHRNPGVLGEALVNDDIFIEIIADGLHVDPIVMEIVFRCKPKSKVIFISDCLPLNMAKSDSVLFGGQQIYRKEGKAVNSEGTFAGSLIFLDSALRNFADGSINELSKYIGFLTHNSADNLGYENLGYIAKDYIADIVIWNPDKNFETVTTIINGKIAYKK